MIIIYESSKNNFRLKNEIGMFKEECSMASLPQYSIRETSVTWHNSLGSMIHEQKLAGVENYFLWRWISPGFK